MFMLLIEDMAEPAGSYATYPAEDHKSTKENEKPLACY
jgi:hypothetical protein